MLTSSPIFTETIFSPCFFLCLIIRNIFAIVRTFIRERLPFWRNSRFILKVAAGAESGSGAIKFGHENFRLLPLPVFIFIRMAYSTKISTCTSFSTSASSIFSSTPFSARLTTWAAILFISMFFSLSSLSPSSINADTAFASSATFTS